MTLYVSFFKPLIDRVVALILIFVFSPLLILTFIILCFSFRGNCFFIQKRPGLNKKIFKVLKFKTMNDDRDDKGRLLPDSKRLTKVGRFIRSTSIDELPQLFNILNGDMSLIGPRPLLTRYLDRYTIEQARRHEVRPGISGWAQVNGRNSISWDERFKLDLWYVDNVSLYLDLKIVIFTLKKVLNREGINSSNCTTMEEFFGNSGPENTH
jgi:undecaprenyl phosphate N,N'-diacetylbacillosamine 1-phosphate transferase